MERHQKTLGPSRLFLTLPLVSDTSQIFPWLTAEPCTGHSLSCQCKRSSTDPASRGRRCSRKLCRQSTPAGCTENWSPWALDCRETVETRVKSFCSFPPRKFWASGKAAGRFRWSRSIQRWRPWWLRCSEKTDRRPSAWTPCLASLRWQSPSHFCCSVVSGGIHWHSRLSCWLSRREGSKSGTNRRFHYFSRSCSLTATMRRLAPVDTGVATFLKKWVRFDIKFTNCFLLHLALLRTWLNARDKNFISLSGTRNPRNLLIKARTALFSFRNIKILSFQPKLRCHEA